MTTTLTAFLTKFNNLLGDSITGTTDAEGNAAKTTFIDSALSRYEDGYFGDSERNPEWWAYVSSQLRTIKKFTQSSGTIEVHKAFSALIATSTAYEIHRFDRDKKIVAINQALNSAYPLFYKRVEDSTTLTGKGPSDTEYSVPVTFIEFPDQIWEKYESGTSIYYTEIIDYDVKEAAGAFKFYANITDDEPIILVGKTYLTAFTTDISTTELSSSQADVVCYLAAAIFYRYLSGVVSSDMSERYDSLANRYDQMWEEKKLSSAMPLLKSKKINYGWLNE